MTSPSAEQLTRLRTRPHYTRLHLSVYEPNTVLAARINMSGITRGEREITIDVISGDVFSVNRGQTVYIGTTPGARDEGRIRAIDCNATTLTVAENDITWIDGQYLTVVQYYEPWAVFPRIVLNDNNVPIFYKDWDIEYTNQNEVMDPVVHMGPNHAMFLENTPTGSWASIHYSSSGTFDPTDDSIPTGYAWIFEGGIPTASFVKDPGYIEYTGAGHFLTSLTVTSNQGKTFTGRRHVSVYTRPDQGPNPPIVSWGLSSFDGSRDQGGYALRFWVRERADARRIDAGSLIVIFTDDAEGPYEDKAGGNAENRSEILFVGYVEEDGTRWNAVTNRVDFRVASITGRMKEVAGFSDTLEDVSSPSQWYEMNNTTVDKAMIHFLRWQSTILTIADFAPTGDEKLVEFMDFGRSNLYDAVNSLYNSSLFASIVSDRQGKIWAEIDINAVPTGSRDANTVLDLTRQDWRSEIGIERRGDEVLSYIEMGGIAYSGVSTGTSDPFLAGAPGDAPAYFGSLERTTGLVLESQAQLNQLTGNVFARRNARYPEVTVPMAGDYRIVDIAPQERILLTLEEDDTYRGVVWTDKQFIPHEVSYLYNAREQSLLMDLTLREETDGPPGETVEIPVDPPFDTFDLPEWDIPPFILPPFPVIPPLEPPPVTGDLVYYAFRKHVVRTRNFFSGEPGPNWESVLDVSLIADLNDVYGLVLDPSDPINTAMVWGPGSGGGYRIYKTTNLDSASPTWTRVLDSTGWTDLVGGTGGDIQQIKPWIQGRVWSLVGTGIGGQKGCGIGISCPFHARSLDGGLTWTRYTIVDSVTYGTPLVIQPTSYAGGQVWAGGQFRIWKSIDAGVTWVQQFVDTPQFTVPLPFPHPENSAAQVMYMSYEIQPIPEQYELYQTVDGGSTWDEFDDTFSYDNETHWGPVTDNSLYGNRQDNFWIHPYTGVGYGMFFAAAKSYAIFCAVTASGITFRAQFQDKVLMWSGHEGDDDLHYAGGPGTNDPRIFGSSDGGFNWFDKEGDIESAVDTFANLGERVSINPVGVV